MNKVPRQLVHCGRLWTRRRAAIGWKLKLYRAADFEQTATATRGLGEDVPVSHALTPPRADHSLLQVDRALSASPTTVASVTLPSQR